MSTITRLLSSDHARTKANSLMSGRPKLRQRRLLALTAWLILEASLFAGPALPVVPGKKLIEYGWDVPTPAQMNQELASMEKRPFEGLIFRLSGGHNAFVAKPLEAEKFADDARILP